MDDLDLARICQETYESPSVTTDGLAFSFKEYEDYNVIAFRGTEPKLLYNWIIDFDAVPNTSKEHPELGICHDGFLDATLKLWPLIQNKLNKKPNIVTGHSLGGAIAILTTGLLTVSNVKVDYFVTYGAPRTVKDDKLINTISHINGKQYKNGNDPVPEVPLYPFRHILPITRIGEFELINIKCHFMANYISSLSKEKSGE